MSSPVSYPGYIDGTAEKSGCGCDCLQGHESTVAQTPDANSIRINITQGLKIIRPASHVLSFTPSEVRVASGRPVPVVAGTAAIVRCEDNVSLLGKILADCVVHAI